MEGLAVTAIALVAFAAIAAAIVVSRRRADAAWSEAASSLGLQYSPGSLFKARRIAGSVGSTTVHVDTHQSGGRNSNTYTRYRVSYPALSLGLAVHRQTGFSRIGKWFGAKDIEIADEAFDEAVILKGDYPDQIRAFLTPGRRLAVHRLITDFRGVKIGDDSISWSRSGDERNATRLVTTVRRFVTVAEALTGHPSRTTNDALERRLRGDLLEAVDGLRRARSDPPDPDMGRLEAEGLYAGGRYDEAAEAFSRVAEQLPADPWLPQWQQRASQRAAAPPARRDPKPEPTRIAAAEVADRVFDARNLSFETTKIFEDEYEGIRVRWRGTLQRANRYSSDLDFGGPGTKAVFEVHTLSNDLFGGRDVDAVVALPPEAHDTLRDRRGETIDFEGTLVRIDALMRNLFLEDGRLI